MGTLCQQLLTVSCVPKKFLFLRAVVLTKTIGGVQVTGLYHNRYKENVQIHKIKLMDILLDGLMDKSVEDFAGYMSVKDFAV